MNLRPMKYESITVADTAIGLTAANIEGTVMGVLCTLETAQIRWRMDGGNPTSTEGHLLEPGQTLEVYNRAGLNSLKFIRTGTTSGVLRVSFLSA